MAQYIMRLDDASDYMDVEKWLRMEEILDRYGVKPLVGIIPDNQDESLAGIYPQDPEFWNTTVPRWLDKGWTPALHGAKHRYVTDCGGINPVNARSEFAGLSYEEQAAKISEGVRYLAEHGVFPKVFFAPSHTFDENTVKALQKCSEIRIISDTIANKPYRKYGMTFVPQQSGRVRKLPFHTVTFCYHPNIMDDRAFEELEAFLENNKHDFIPFPLDEVHRKESVIDLLLRKLYFLRR